MVFGTHHLHIFLHVGVPNESRRLSVSKIARKNKILNHQSKTFTQHAHFPTPKSHLFSSTGNPKNACAIPNCRTTSPSSIPVPVTTQNPQRFTASWRSAASLCLPPGDAKCERSIAGRGVQERGWVVEGGRTQGGIVGGGPGGGVEMRVDMGWD